MVLLKIYAVASFLIGLMEIAAGVVTSSSRFSAGVNKLFGLFGMLGSFGAVELFWLGVSTIAAVILARKSLPFVPPVVFVAFCLLHPMFQALLPDSATMGEAVLIKISNPAAIVGVAFGLLYLFLNGIYYKSYFFPPRLFDDK